MDVYHFTSSGSHSDSKVRTYVQMVNGQTLSPTVRELEGLCPKQSLQSAKQQTTKPTLSHPSTIQSISETSQV